MVLEVCRQESRRSAPCRGCLSGCVSRVGSQGSFDSRPRAVGNWLYGVAIRTAVPRQQIARRQRQEGVAGGVVRSGSCDLTRSRPRRPTGRRSTASRPRPSTTRSTACRRLSACRWCFATSRTHPRPGCHATSLPGGHAPQPAWPAAREKLKISLARQALPACRCYGLSLEVCASASIPPLLRDSTTRAAMRFAASNAAAGGGSRSARHWLGGPRTHVLPQAQAQRNFPLTGRRCRHRRGLSTLDGDAGKVQLRTGAAFAEEVRSPEGDPEQSYHQIGSRRRGPDDRRRRVLGEQQAHQGAVVDLVHLRPRLPWVGASDK